MKFLFQIIHILVFGSILWKRAVLHEYLAGERILSIMCMSIFAETLGGIERPLTGLMVDNSRPLAHPTMGCIVREAAVHGTDVSTFIGGFTSQVYQNASHLYIFKTLKLSEDIKSRFTSKGK